MNLISQARRSHRIARDKLHPHRLELPPFAICMRILGGSIKTILIIGSIILFYFVACALFDDCLRGLL